VAWAAVVAVAKAELRARWRGLAALGLLLGLLGGSAIALAVVARRTGTAYPRLVAATHRHDATVLVAGDRVGVAGEVAKLPGVEASWVPGAWTGQIHNIGSLNYLAFAAGPDHPADLLHPVVLRGRAPRADAADEILISEAMAGDFPVKLNVGSHLDLTLLTPGQFARFDTGFGDPAGPAVRLRVVGVGRLPLWGDGIQAIAAPAFAATYRANRVGQLVFLRLDTADPARRAFADGLARLAAARPPPPEFAEFGPLQAKYAAAEEAPWVAPAQRITVAGLTAAAVLAGLAALLVTAQALARHHAAGWAAQRVEAALGMTRIERALARVLPAAPGALLAGAVGAAAGLAAGRLGPLGALHRFEPAPGYRPDIAAAAVGGACLAALFLLAAAVTAATTLRSSSAATLAAAPAPSVRAPVGWLPAALRAGWCLARGERRSGLATAGGVLGAAGGVAVVVAVVVFGASLDRLVATPSRYGWTADLSVNDAKDDEIARLVADRRVAAVTVVAFSQTSVGAEAVWVTAFEPRKGDAGPAMAAGRLPTTAAEVAVGPRLAARLDLAPGDDFVLDRPGRPPFRLRVVGIAVARHIGVEVRQGNDVVVHPDALPHMVGTASWREADVQAVAGHADELVAELAERFEIGTAEPPPEVVALADIRRLPYVLAAVAGVGALAGLLHAAQTGRRRNRRELAVLRAVGFTRGQVRATRVVMTTALVVPALAIGVPVGVGAGRLVWHEVAVASGVAGDALIPAGWLTAITATALLTALIAAAAGGPGRAEPVGAALRAE
jgi:hypothetical protein